MLRLILLLILLILIVRAFSRVMGGVVEGMRQSPQKPQPPSRAVSMQRDPVCGTFVLPERAVTLTLGPEHLYFCSTACRDKYRARTA